MIGELAATEGPPVQVDVVAADGARIVARRFDVDGDHQPRARLVIAPAMAIHQKFYEAFARWLAGQGIEAWTFDYRGTGASWPRPMRGAPGTLDQWCAQDYDAMLRHVAALQPAAPLLWYFLVPVLCPAFGYFPGSRIGVIGDVPTGAMRQWRRWCLSPDYLLGAEPGARAAYATATYPVFSLSFADDELLLPAGSDMIHAAYRAADVDYRVLAPSDVGMSRIGHAGFFRSAAQATLWPMVLRWLDAHLGGLPAASLAGSAAA